MSWVRLDDQFHNHPKLPMLGSTMLACIGLHTLALSWCSAYLTDGFIPKDQIPRLAGDLSLLLPEGNPWDLVARLVAVNLWEDGEEGYQIHDYLDYNPSKRDVVKLRKMRAELGKKGGKQKASNLSSKLLASEVANALANKKQNRTPSPSPSPFPQDLKKEEAKTTPPADAGVADSSLNGWGTPEALVALYNEATPDECPSVTKLSPARRVKAKRYLSAFPDRDFWASTFEQIKLSPFLSGLKPSQDGRRFVADFDWLLTKGKDGTENAIKVYEGKYAES